MRGWSTISQEFNSKRVLLEVLHCVGCIGSEDNEYEELGQKLYQNLIGRRYLIVMDDIWGTDAWDEMKRFFPNNNKGSRVLITTRVLLEILHCIGCIGSEESEYEELGNKLYRSLFKRRYLIVMDDIWSTDAWDEMKRFFPNNDDGSRVLITTRASKVALHLDGPNYFQMPFLEVDESWNLLRRCVFGEEQQGSPPPELEAIGKNIATNCRGLPLSIVVIGGLLAKSEQTRENWQRVLENLSSTVNLEEDERCFKILKLSYDQLPVHLKPCFLYMGMYREDDWINVSMLMRLWVDEGFVKPVAGKSLETIARVVYLNDLVLRNLIVVRERGCNGRIKSGLPDGSGPNPSRSDR
ncbi:disease resistance protein RGH3 [Striga asiatica]|uniref:Disease resistance protein RGH3 n=1 Tax=Striga asiatica TaxID=4170 RepID=A0A5A7R7H6_STRAF|nr:disease resistance protein RGH3 [Striga asiatica]